MCVPPPPPTLHKSDLSSAPQCHTPSTPPHTRRTHRVLLPPNGWHAPTPHRAPTMTRPEWIPTRISTLRPVAGFITLAAEPSMRLANSRSCTACSSHSTKSPVAACECRVHGAVQRLCCDGTAAIVNTHTTMLHPPYLPCNSPRW